MQPQAAVAQVKASYTKSTPEKDPGNEIEQQDVLLEGSFNVYQAEDRKRAYGVGFSVLSTTLKFDEPVIGTVDLLKLQVPLTGQNALSGGTIFSWTVAPGLYGEHGGLADAEFRVQGQALLVVPNTETRQWVAGLAAGDQFGDYMIFPVFGLIWSPDKQSKLTAVLPMIQYDYMATEKITYRATFRPVGSDWTFKRGDIGNVYEGNIILRGYRLSVGADWLLSDKTHLFVDLGVTTSREFEVERANSSISDSVDLKDAWVFELGLQFD